MKKTILFFLTFLFFSFTDAQTTSRIQQFINEVALYEKAPIKSGTLQEIELTSRRAFKAAYENKKLFTFSSLQEITWELVDEQYRARLVVPNKIRLDFNKIIKADIGQYITGRVFLARFKLVPSRSDSLYFKERKEICPKCEHIVPWDSWEKTDQFFAEVDSNFKERDLTYGADKDDESRAAYFEADVQILIYVDLALAEKIPAKKQPLPFPLYIATTGELNVVRSDPSWWGDIRYIRQSFYYRTPKSGEPERIPIVQPQPKKVIVRTRIPEQPVAVKPASESVVITSPSSATVSVTEPVKMLIGDLQSYDHDTVSVWIVSGNRTYKTRPVELALKDWVSYDVAPGSLVIVNAVAEGLVPPCTIGVRLSNGKTFSLQAKKGEQMKIQFDGP